jgi:hypothetical protein
MARDRPLAMSRHSCRLRYMAEWSEDHVSAIGLFKLNFVLVVWLWLSWRLGGALRWKGEDHWLRRSGSGVWKADTFKAVAPACVR